MLERGCFPGAGRLRSSWRRPKALARGEVVHLVVEDKAKALDDEHAAELKVDGLGAGDGVAEGIDRRQMAGAGVAEFL
jgi:hypothetical protein